MARLWRDYGGTMAIVPPSRCAHGVATEYAPYAPDTARGYLIYAGHGVPTEYEPYDVPTARPAGVATVLPRNTEHTEQTPRGCI